MALTVGINENVVLKSAVINDKGTLEITFGKKEQDLSEVATDDLLNDAAGIKPRGNDTRIMLWPFNAEANGAAREVKHITSDVASLRDQLEHILQGYMTTVEAKLNPYDGLALTKDNINTEVVKQSVLDRMYKNLTTQFVAKVKGLASTDLEKEFRLLLVRSSATNHYGKLRSRFISDNPFWESTAIPATASKLKFTKYEIEKGLNSGEPVAKEQVADQTDEAQSTADDILGTR